MSFARYSKLTFDGIMYFAMAADYQFNLLPTSKNGRFSEEHNFPKLLLQI